MFWHNVSSLSVIFYTLFIPIITRENLNRHNLANSTSDPLFFHASKTLTIISDIVVNQFIFKLFKCIIYGDFKKNICQEIFIIFLYLT